MIPITLHFHIHVHYLHTYPRDKYNFGKARVVVKHARKRKGNASRLQVAFQFFQAARARLQQSQLRAFHAAAARRQAKERPVQR